MNYIPTETISLDRYQQNPQAFFEDAWPDIILWDKLVEVLEAVAKHKRVAIPSGHGVGKTFILARLALWFLNCFYPSKVITTAPTWPQVELLLWSELRHAFNTSQFLLGGKVLTTELKIEDDWFAIGISTRGKAAEREYGTPKFQGWHSENLLALLDEAPGVENEIWTSIESLLVGANNKVVAGGNPTSPSGKFYDACKSPLWQKINISSFDHPNVQQNKIIIPGAVTSEWINERRQEWGEGTPLWQAKVLGTFPVEGTDTLIPLTAAEACVGLGLSSAGLKRLGVDVARYGADQTSLCRIYGAVVQPIEAVNKKDTNWTCGRVINLNKQDEFDAIGVDDTGVGGGVTDSLEDSGVEVDAVNFGEAAIETDKFENRKAEIYWNLREAILKKELELPDDKELINQLCSIRYKFTRKGKYAIESKDDLKKRGLKSPDKADSLAIAFSAGLMNDTPIITVLDGTDEE